MRPLPHASSRTLEAALSRFRPTSDLERLNASAAETVIVSPLLAAAIDDALRAAAATDGLCDPTIAAALEAAGYDRSFELIEPGRPGGRLKPVTPRDAGGRSGSPASSYAVHPGSGSTSTGS